MEQRPLDEQQPTDALADEDDAISRARLADGQVMDVKPGSLAAAKDALAARKATERSSSETDTEQIDPEDFRSVQQP